MKQILLAAACAVIVAAAANAAEPAKTKGKDEGSLLKDFYISTKFLYVDQKINNNMLLPQSIAQNKNVGNFGGALAVGYDFHGRYGVPVRLEFEYAIREGSGLVRGPVAAQTFSSLKSETYALNGYYDFRNDSKFVPYVGFGLGVAHNDAFGGMLGIAVDGTKISFAYNIGAGVNYALDKNMFIGLGYRYFDYGKHEARIESGGAALGFSGDSSGHELLVSLTYKF